MTTSSSPLSLYLHWPYCARICPYCDFNVHLARRREAEAPALVEAMGRDLALQREVTGPREVVSVHFGGGTPSLMEAGWVARLLERVDTLWGLPGTAEVGLEANPTLMGRAQAEGFRAGGVNRLSFGVQTFAEAGLRRLGRDHGAEEARRAVEDALEVMDNVSCDLIFGWKGQTDAVWRRDLETTLALGVPHVSAYQLTVEAGTAYGKALERGDDPAVGAEASEGFYGVAEAVLREAGFAHYEVSNWARKGYRSVHNFAVWQGVDYLGVGPGAHGRITVEGVRRATLHARRPADYIANPVPEVEVLDAEDAALERLLLGLRTVEGVGLTEVAALEMPGLAELEGLLEARGDRLVATPDGRRVLDAVVGRLLG